MNTNDFINIYNHIANNRNVLDYRCHLDKRFKVKLKASTTSGNSFTFTFRGLDYYCFIEHRSKGDTKWLYQERNGEVIQAQGYRLSQLSE